MIAIIITLYLKSNSQEETDSPKQGSAKPKLSKEYTLSINRSIFEGISSDSLPYTIYAENVMKNSENKYVLKAIEGTYTLTDGDITLKAINGTIDEFNQFVTLKNNAQIEYNGIVFNSDKIKLHLDNQDIESDTPVDVNFKNSNIKADSFKAKNSGKDIIFEGNVESEFDLK